MIDGRNGVRYLTASEIRHQDGYTDITPDLLRTWAHAGRLRPVTLAEIAAALGHPLPPGADGTAPAQARGRSGPENLYRWADIVTVETATRLHRRRHGGRTRGRTPRQPISPTT